MLNSRKETLGPTCLFIFKITVIKADATLLVQGCKPKLEVYRIIMAYGESMNIWNNLPIFEIVCPALIGISDVVAVKRGHTRTLSGNC